MSLLIKFRVGNMESILKVICVVWYSIIVIMTVVSSGMDLLLESLSLLWLGVLICNLSDIEDIS